jgi:hypothetical protein
MAPNEKNGAEEGPSRVRRRLQRGGDRMNRYAFFYFMKEDPQAVRAAVPRHIDYWKALAPADYLGGPFADRSGGLITFFTAVAETVGGLLSYDCGSSPM